MKKLLIILLLAMSALLGVSHATEVTLETKITGLYVAFFSRAADEGGLTYWTNRGNSSPNQSSVLKELAAGFAQHPSFDRAYGELNNRSFVEEIYKNALGREGDTPGIDYWSGRLNLPLSDPNYLSRSDFVSVFVEAALTFDRNDPQYIGLDEAVLDAAQLRKDLISNKVEVALAFTHQLGILSNVTDTDNPESDPAYLASIRIISEVTENIGTVNTVLDFLESIKLDDNEINQINHSCAIASTLLTSTMYGEIIENSGDIKHYKIIVSEWGELKIYSTGELDTVAELYDNTATLVAENDDIDYPDNNNFEIIYNANPGEYCLEITSFWGDTGSFNLHFEPTDTIAPVITLTGGTSELFVNGIFTAPTATVTDNKDTGLVATVTGTVDTTTAGSYTLRYNASDSAGNSADEVSFTVTVNEMPVTTLILSLATDMGNSKLSDVLSPEKESKIILSELNESTIQVEVTTSSGKRILPTTSVSVDENSITFTSPQDIIGGNLTIKKNGEVLVSQSYGVLTASMPYLTDIAPWITQAGDTVEITGVNLPSIPVQVVFEDQNSSLTQTVTPSGNTVSFTVPPGAGSGNIYLQIGEMKTNSLYLSVKRTIDVHVALGQDISFDASKISFILGLEEHTLDASYHTTLNVENKDMQYLNAVVELPDDEAALLYSAVVLPDMSGTVTIDADSTAVTWIFMGMGASVATDKDELRALYDMVKTNVKVQEFATYINTLQKNDFAAWALLSDEELQTKFQDALKDVIETPMARSARSMMARDVDPGAVIVKQVPTNNRIHVNMDKLDKGSVTIINDTKLYLSVEVKSNEEERKGQIVEGYHHVIDAIYTGEGTLIGPHGWGMAGVSSETTLEVEGEDSHIEIITAGILGQTDKTGLSNSLRTRTILEGMAIPAVNIALNMILDARFKGNTSYFVDGMRHIYINGDFLKQLTTEVSKGSSNFSKAVDHLVVKPLVNGLKGCLQPAITDICKDTIKGLAMIIGIKGTAQTIGKKILFKITLNAGKSAMKKSLVAIPVAGWIGAGVIAVLDNLGNIADSTSMLKSVWDMDFNPKEINIDVEFPFEISEVTPTCIAISPSEAVPTFYIKGGGFTEVDNLKPLVYIGAGDDKSEPYELLIKPDATQMYAKFYTDELMDDGSWSSHMFVKHMGISIMYDKVIRMVSTEDEKVYFDSVVPNRAMLGQTVTLNGCGWVPLESVKVYFPSVDNEEIEAEILSKTIDKIEVKVPQSAKSGLVRIQTGQKEETRWFDVIPFGIFKASVDSLNDGTLFALEGKGLLNTTHLYFVDHEENRLEGIIENIASDSGMYVKTPDGLAAGLVRLYVVLSDGMKSNELTLPKLPKSPTANPSSGVIAEGLTVSLSQEEDVDIYYMLNDNIAGTEQKYSTPLNLSLDDLKNTDLTLYAFARQTVNGVDYDSDKAEFYYYPCEEGYELKNGECVHDDLIKGSFTSKASVLELYYDTDNYDVDDLVVTNHTEWSIDANTDIDVEARSSDIWANSQHHTQTTNLIYTTEGIFTSTKHPTGSFVMTLTHDLVEGTRLNSEYNDLWCEVGKAYYTIGEIYSNPGYVSSSYFQFNANLEGNQLTGNYEFTGGSSGYISISLRIPLSCQAGDEQNNYEVSIPSHHIKFTTP